MASETEADAESLNDDVLAVCLSRVQPPRERARLALVCKRWARILEQPHVWPVVELDATETSQGVNHAAAAVWLAKRASVRQRGRWGLRDRLAAACARMGCRQSA